MHNILIDLIALVIITFFAIDYLVNIPPTATVKHAITLGLFVVAIYGS